MRKKIERLERRDQGVNKKAEQPKVIEEAYLDDYQSSIQELNKTEILDDDWKAIRKHPVTKIVMVVGITMGLIYMSSHVFNLAAKAAISYKKFRKALEG